MIDWLHDGKLLLFFIATKEKFYKSMIDNLLSNSSLNVYLPLIIVFVQEAKNMFKITINNYITGQKDSF